jgi:hypothetical protein
MPVQGITDPPVLQITKMPIIEGYIRFEALKVVLRLQSSGM